MPPFGSISIKPPSSALASIFERRRRIDLQDKFQGGEMSIMQWDGDCVEWRWAKENGYGVVKLGGRKQWVHRVAYRLFVGELGKKDVHHKCGNKGCINPDHLELVTPAEHYEKHDGREPIMGVMNRSKTHCKWGHPFDERNTYHRPNGGRECIICKRAGRRKKRYGLEVEIP